MAKIARHYWRGVHWVKGPRGPRPVREPLKKQHLERHLDGGPGVGLAPIAPGENTCRVAVLDIDSHKGEIAWEAIIEKCRAIVATLRQRDLAPIPFRSSGGKGIHLIMLWDEPQDAYSVRELLREVLGIMGLKPGTKGVKHGEVEIFPKQDDVPSDGIGSMVILPLCGESLPLDPESFKLLDYSYAEGMRDWPKSKPVPVLERPARQAVNPSSSIDPASLSTPLAEIRSALAAIPNEGSESQDYDSWRNVIFAVHHATDGSAEGLALALEWSARSPKHDAEFLETRVWPYVRSDRGGKVITAATLFARARQHGYEENILDEFEILPPEELTPQPQIEGKTPPAGKPARFAVQPIGAFADRKSPGWIVRNIVPRTELMLLIGESGAGKSFIAFDLAAAIARGEPWRNYKTQQGRVVYVVAEGAGFFHQRAIAYAKRHNLSLNELQIGVISDAPNLMLKDDVKSVVMQVNAFGKVDVIIIDTFAQATAGANENAGEDMGTALANCKALARATGALVVLVHHVGKDESKGARGWSGLKAAADAEITVTRRDNLRAAAVSKMKDGADGAVLPFKLVDVDLGKDEEGEPITSCIVEHLEAREEGRQARQPQGVNARIVWEAAHNLAALSGEVMVSELLAVTVKDMTYDPEKRDRRRELALRALDVLKDQGFLRVSDNRVLLLPTGSQ